MAPIGPFATQEEAAEACSGSDGSESDGPEPDTVCGCTRPNQLFATVGSMCVGSNTGPYELTWNGSAWEYNAAPANGHLHLITLTDCSITYAGLCGDYGCCAGNPYGGTAAKSPASTCTPFAIYFDGNCGDCGGALGITVTD